jgi:hypothetical protein
MSNGQNQNQGGQTGNNQSGQRAAPQGGKQQDGQSTTKDGSAAGAAGAAKTGKDGKDGNQQVSAGANQPGANKST